MYCSITEEMNNMAIIKIPLTVDYKSPVRELTEDYPDSLRDLMLDEVPDYGLYLPL